MKSLLSICFYGFVFCLSAGLIYWGFKTYKKNKFGLLLVVLGVLVPSVVAGIRYGVGVDFSTYLGMYENVVNGQPMYYRSIEPASSLVIYTAAFLRSSVSMFFTFSLATNVCFLWAFKRFFGKNYKLTTLSFFMYLCIVFPTTLNAVRSGLAIALVTLSFSYLVKEWSRNSLIKSVIILLVAFLFHRSALIALAFLPVFYLVNEKPEDQKLFAKKIALWAVYLLPMILLPLLYLVVKDVLPANDYSKYLRGLGGSFSIPLANLVMMAPIVFAGLYMLINKNEMKNECLKRIFYIAVFYIPLTVLVGWFTYEEGMSRISFILDPIIIVLMTYLVAEFKKMKTFWKIAMTMCVTIVVGLMFVRNLRWSKVLPYRTVFNQEVSYAQQD